MPLGYSQKENLEAEAVRLLPLEVRLKASMKGRC